MAEDYERTVISIIDEHGENSTITLDKWTSDVLHEHIGDVHLYIQKLYSAVCKQNDNRGLQVSRREKGNTVRQYANRKAMEFKPINIDIEEFERLLKEDER